jgi:uncharacterized protein (DUF1778 family)
MPRIEGTASQPNLGWKKNGRPGRRQLGLRLPEQLYDALSRVAEARGVTRSRFTVEALGSRHCSTFIGDES